MLDGGDDSAGPPDAVVRPSLARGALCAWEVAAGTRLDAAFEYMFREDPFSGHVVIRTTDAVTRAAPTGFGRRSRFRKAFRCGNTLSCCARRGSARALPADAGQDALHAGGRARAPARARAGRARRRTGAAAGHDARRALRARVARPDRAQTRVRARTKSFATFGARGPPKPAWISRRSPTSRGGSERARRDRAVLDVSRARQTNRERRTRHALQRALPLGGTAGPRDGGRAARSARHYVITHAYWREGGPEFHDVNVMAVAHGMEKAVVLAHKAAIDAHLREARHRVCVHERVLGRPQRDQTIGDRTGRVSRFCRSHGIDPETMLADAARKEPRPEEHVAAFALRR